MDSLQVRIRLPGELHEPLAAILSAYSAQGFHFADEDFVAYWLVGDYTDDVRATLRGFLLRHELDPRWDESEVRDRNWNSAWEAGFEPVVAGPFFIRSSWHEPAEERAGVVEIVVDPKMSFGTGHHESTRLMLYHLDRHRGRLDRVLDAGSGTGILAIAAHLLGAGFVLAYDVDPRCIVNARENLDENGIRSGVDVRTGALESVPERDFTLIMANINRHILLENLSGFRDRLTGDGILALSGLLVSDRDKMLAAAARLPLHPLEERSEGEWWSVALENRAG